MLAALGNVMQWTTATDADLLAASRTGQVDAFGQLVERYESLVHAVCLSTTGHPTLSEDVAQETFLTAWAQLGSLREPGRFRAWLCSIARNLSRKARKKRGREVLVEAVETETLESPLAAAIDRETEALVWSAMERVPAKYREVLVLFYQEGRSAQEVARMLDLSESAVHQRLSRGRRHLKSCVESTVESVLSQKKKNPTFAATIVFLLSSGAVQAAPGAPAAPSAIETSTPTTEAIFPWALATKLAAMLALLFTPLIAWQFTAPSASSPSIKMAAEPISIPDAPLVAGKPRPPLKPTVLPESTETSPASSESKTGSCGQIEITGARPRWAHGALAEAVAPCYANLQASASTFALTLHRDRVVAATLVDPSPSDASAAERCIVQALADFPIEALGDEPVRLVRTAAPKKSPVEAPTHVVVSNLEGAPRRGPDSAAITMVVFNDPVCYFCGKILGTLDQLLDEYPQDIQLVVKTIALNAEHDLATEALLAAHAQGRFWSMHDVIMAHQDALDRTSLAQYAAQAGLDRPRFEQDLDRHTFLPKVQADRAEFQALGLRGIPATMINGEVITGAQPIDKYHAIIRRILHQ